MILFHGDPTILPQYPISNSVGVEPCATFSVGGGAPVNFIGRGPKKPAAAAARPGLDWIVKFTNFAYLFQTFLSKELLLSRYACSKICLRLSGLKFEEKNIYKQAFSNKRLQNQAVWCSDFKFK